MFLNDAIRATWLPGLHLVGEKPAVDLKGWLRGGDYHVGTESTPDLIFLTVHDLGESRRALSSDVNRMSNSALETIQSISVVDKMPKSLAWLMIKLYYSSFFCANAIMRMQGVSCSYFDVSDFLRLRRLADASGILNANKFSGGQYVCRLDVGKKQWVFEKSKSSAHEFLWDIFGKQVGVMRNSLNADLLGVAYVKEAKDFYAGLEQIICDKGSLNGNWLSQVRNAVNYRQEFSAWYPSKPKHSAASLKSIVDKIKSSDLDKMIYRSGDDLKDYVNACVAINVMMRGTLADMAARSSGTKSFLSYGPLALENFLNKPVAA